MRSVILCSALLALVSGPAPAQPAPDAREPGAELSVFLLTMGQGDLVWEKFGHNAIWIRDPGAGTDLVYNYGVFDFDSPGYWGRFVRGDWVYQLAVNTVDEILGAYQYFDRTIVAQELNLTPAQKAQLQEFLDWNALPENREYRYDYYLDNCSTRLRDALDRLLGGAMLAQNAGVLTETTYRWHSRRLIASDRLAYAGLAAGLGPAADRPISRWEEMFLPEKLKERVREVRVRRGEALEPLVLAEMVLYESTGREPEREEPPGWVEWFLLIGAAVGALMAGLGEATRRGSAVGRFVLAALSGIWGLLIGTGGLILVGLWTFTNHTIAHANENLLHFDPLALGLALLVPAAAYGVRWAAVPAWWLAMTVLGISVLGFAAQVLPGLDQVNAEIIALLLPAHLGLAWATHRIQPR
jgi:hypothetical protein